MAIDPDDKKVVDTQTMLNMKFEQPQKEAKEKLTRSAALAKARAAKAAKSGKSPVADSTAVVTSITNQIRDEQVWREAMVAQMVNGRVVSPTQLDGAVKLADAYLELVKARF